MRAHLLFFLLLGILAGCGYKGPLYLPTLPTAKPAPKPEAVVTPDPERPVPAELVPPPK